MGEFDWRSLALWAAGRPRPQRPELVPGLPGVNAQRLEAWRCELVAWKIGKAEALLRGLPER